MSAPDFLKKGYERFRFGPKARKIKQLSQGQSPKVMVIGCSDSRVHPATIFDADAGNIFMVRNVANIVPPYEEGGGYHGTSAALEFAINSLKIKYILVLGHSGCGGIAASLAQGKDHPVGQFIGPWVDLMSEVRETVCRMHKGASQDVLQIYLEKANVRQSLQNLLTFPFIHTAANAGDLNLLGAWFDIKTAELEWME